MLIAGASKIYSVPGFLFEILLAAAPVSLLVMIFGAEIPNPWRTAHGS